MREVVLHPLNEEFGMAISDDSYRMEIEEPVENCIFHKWVTRKYPHPENNEFMQNQELGMIEMPDGVIKYFRPEQIIFKK